jgi:hypothetical protein
VGKYKQLTKTREQSVLNGDARPGLTTESAFHQIVRSINREEAPGSEGDFQRAPLSLATDEHGCADMKTN